MAEFIQGVSSASKGSTQSAGSYRSAAMTLLKLVFYIKCNSVHNLASSNSGVLDLLGVSSINQHNCELHTRLYNYFDYITI